MLIIIAQSRELYLYVVPFESGIVSFSTLFEVIELVVELNGSSSPRVLLPRTPGTLKYTSPYTDFQMILLGTPVYLQVPHLS